MMKFGGNDNKVIIVLYILCLLIIPLASAPMLYFPILNKFLPPSPISPNITHLPLPREAWWRELFFYFLISTELQFKASSRWLLPTSLSLSFCLFLSLCFFVWVCLSSFVCMGLFVSVSLSVSVFMSFCLFLFFSLSVFFVFSPIPTCLFVSLFVKLYIFVLHQPSSDLYLRSIHVLLLLKSHRLLEQSNA